ncbi:MAG: ATP-binding cassette domain-containing protein [Cyanobacteriota bacterium]|jgi:phosphonate transport system ATP-binding protein|nr:ATP-binding cassette domain-containing protein [Cyanobacteriota bacterium]
MLSLQDITVRGRGQPRLDRVSLELTAGERVALIGASGAGKSTLLAVANGQLTPDHGCVRWQGEVQARRGSRRRRRQQSRIGMLWQELRLIEELSVQQNINAAQLAHWGWPRALLNLLLPLDTAVCSALMERLDLDPALLTQPVSSLSGGQRQRVALARLLRQDPLLLLADEPLASLDPRLAQELLGLLLEQAEAPRSLLMSLHRPDLLPHFQRVVGLRAGRVLFDLPPSEVVGEQLKALYAGSDSRP